MHRLFTKKLPDKRPLLLKGEKSSRRSIYAYMLRGYIFDFRSIIALGSWAPVSQFEQCDRRFEQINLLPHSRLTSPQSGHQELERDFRPTFLLLQDSLAGS